MRDPNSIRTWHRIQNDGRVAASRRRVFNDLCRRGPCTAQELVAFSRYPHAEKRLSELERQGLITRLEPTICSITGETAWTWDVIHDATPIPLEKPKLTSAQRIAAMEEAIEELQERVFQLEQKQQPMPTVPRQGVLW